MSSESSNSDDEQGYQSNSAIDPTQVDPRKRHLQKVAGESRQGYATAGQHENTEKKSQSSEHELADSPGSYEQHRPTADGGNAQYDAADSSSDDSVSAALQPTQPAWAGDDEDDGELPTQAQPAQRTRLTSHSDSGSSSDSSAELSEERHKSPEIEVEDHSQSHEVPATQPVRVAGRERKSSVASSDSDWSAASPKKTAAEIDPEQTSANHSPVGESQQSWQDEDTKAADISGASDSDVPTQAKGTNAQDVVDDLFGSDSDSSLSVSSRGSRSPTRSHDGEGASKADTAMESDRESNLSGAGHVQDSEDEDMDGGNDYADRSVDLEIPYTEEPDKDAGLDPPTIMKLPNFFSVDSRPFDPENYEEEGNQVVVDAEGRKRVKLAQENTIRWRYNTDAEGNQIKETNTKLVKWDDGTMSLALGNEFFDIKVKDMQGEHTHIYAKAGECLYGTAVIKQRYLFSVADMVNSRTHKRLTAINSQRFAKSAKVLKTHMEMDPKKYTMEMTRKEEERIQARAKLKAKQRHLEQKKSKLDTQYLEQRYESDGLSNDELERTVEAVKKSVHGQRESSSSESSSESAEDSEAERRLDRAKLANVDSAQESDSDSSGQPVQQHRKRTQVETDSEDSSG